MVLRRPGERSRQSLVDAARARGIEGAEFLTRAELERLLEGGPQREGGLLARGAKRVLNRLLSFATGAEEEERTEAPATRDVGAEASRSVAVDAPIAAASTKDDVLPETTTAIDAVRLEVSKEPIRTRTMAQLFATQGLERRALAIYEDLLAEEPDNDGLLEEAALIRRRLEGGAQAPPAEAPGAVQGRVRPEEAPPAREPARSDEAAPFAAPPREGRREGGAPQIDLPFSPPTTPAAPTVDRVLAFVVDSETIFVRWEVSAAGRARARAVLGSDGEICLRVVLIAPGVEGSVRSEVLDHGPLYDVGEELVRGVPAGATCLAAVGLRSKLRFVAISHTQAKRTPASAAELIPAIETVRAPSIPPPGTPGVALVRKALVEGKTDLVRARAGAVSSIVAREMRGGAATSSSPHGRR